MEIVWQILHCRVLHKMKDFTNNVDKSLVQIARLSCRPVTLTTQSSPDPVCGLMWQKKGPLNGSFGLFAPPLPPMSSMPCTIQCPRLATNQAVMQRYVSNYCFPVVSWFDWSQLWEKRKAAHQEVNSGESTQFPAARGLTWGAITYCAIVFYYIFLDLIHFHH